MHSPPLRRAGHAYLCETPEHHGMYSSIMALEQ
jgi:hypothetical protein